MNKKIKNLFQKEKMLELNLHNCNHQLGLYSQKLEALKATKTFNEEEKEQLKRFSKIFKYYKKDLIPALEEMLQLDAKHINLIKKNPDSAFTPVKIEFQNHEKLLKQFLHRFEEIHKEFHDFTININK